MGIATELLYDRHEHAREHDCKKLAGMVFEEAFQSLARAERCVKRYSGRLREMPVRPADRTRSWNRLYYIVQPIVKGLREDRAFFLSEQHDTWAYWLDMDTDVNRREFLRRADRVLELVDELTRGAM